MEGKEKIENVNASTILITPNQLDKDNN